MPYVTCFPCDNRSFMYLSGQPGEKMFPEIKALIYGCLNVVLLTLLYMLYLNTWIRNNALNQL